MTIRTANAQDIAPMSELRFSVTENVLNNRALVTEAIYLDYLTRRGRGWVCEIDGYLVGFAIADLLNHSIWALFVRPGFEGKGIGQRLHDTMLRWYFTQTPAKVWLTTGANTRAVEFYRRAGWQEMGREANGEIRFDLTKADFAALKQD